MKQLVGEIKISTTFDLMTGNQNGIQLRKTAPRARDSWNGVDHKNQSAQLPFHNIHDLLGWCIAHVELRTEPLARLHGVFKTRISGEA